MFQKVKVYVTVIVTLLAISLGLSVKAGAAEDLAVTKTSIVLESYEFGPAVTKVIFEFNQKVTPEVVHSSTQVTTAGVSRQVTNSYVSDDQGHVVYYDNSKYVTLELSLPSYNRYNMGGNAEPMYFNLSTWTNQWLESYMVSMKDLSLVAEGSSQSQMVSSEQDAINNRLMPTTEVFDERGQVGNMQYAAYSAQTGTGNSTKPLIVWLHGIGERGTDMNIPLLSNDVYALTQPEIQGHFLTTGDQARGVNVLAVQTQTPWGSDNAAQLKETIDTYLANHPEVDKGRIYLAGVSNGGGMVLTMGATYPDYFAALVPIAAPLTVDQSGIDKLKNQPMWLIHTKADATVQPENSVLPLYKSLITSGATNKWFSYFETATGTDLPGTEYDGHWAWIYFFHDQVIGVQHPENTKNWDGYSGMVATDPTYGGGSRASVNGQTYNSIFDWMSAQRH